MLEERLTKSYMRAVQLAGAVACVYSAVNLPWGRLDWHFWLLATITVTVSSHLTVQIPRVSGRVTVSDTFIFLTMLLYGGEAAVLVAMAEALCSSWNFSKRAIPMSHFSGLFNAAMMGCATFLTALTLRLCFGDVAAVARGNFPSTVIVAVCVMALVQYLANSGLAATQTALKTGQPLRRTWTRHYLWTSITYFAGAAVAGITAKVVVEVGFYGIILVTPIVAIVFFTYSIYLKNVETTAIAAKAEQAERHVVELSHYIAEQERIREQFSQVEKLSALGELASGVAHDFNNTLAGVLGRAELLKMTDDPEKIQKGLDLIIKTAKDGAKTVRRIQDFACQRRDQDFAPVPVDQLLFDVGDITRPRWKNRAEATNVQIHLEVQIRSNALVMGDESELREVLVNMIFNAVDAMPHGGLLTLAAEEEDGGVVISISDTGMGMSEEVRSRVFDPFFTTKGKAGMGLGLAVSYGIIRRHDASVEVHSEPGRGTSFKIKLPVVKGLATARPAAVTTSAVAAMTPANRHRVLVVEDETHVRELLRDILEKAGCQVLLAESGAAALELFRALNFDAVFTDVGLPDRSGWELARTLRALDAGVPITAVTGWGDAIGSKERVEAGVNWVIAKPFTVEQIMEVVRRIEGLREEGIVRSLAATA